MAAAAWITATFGVEARVIRDLGLRDAQDSPNFQAARAAGPVVMTKQHVQRRGGGVAGRFGLRLGWLGR